MDPYGAYACSSDFETSRTQGNPDQTKFFLAQQHQQQQLPPFRELLGTGHQPLVDPANTHPSALDPQAGNMTRRTFQAAAQPLKIEPPSPERLPNGASLEGFETMSTQSGDSSYASQRHQRQSSSWTSGSHYNDTVSPYGGQQRPPCTIQTQFPLPKVSPSLPSIRDFDRVTTCNSSFSATGSYGSVYGPGNGPYSSAHDYSMKPEPPYSLKSDTLPYCDSPHRYGQVYSHPNRPNAQTDYTRYVPAIYDFPRNIAYQPYGGDYIPSPTGSGPAVSPTVPNTNGGRKRRGNLPKEITEYLKRWFLAHLDHPYPTEDDKHQFVQDTGLTIAQISNWFINARRRHLPAWRNQRAQASAGEYDSDKSRRQH